MEQKTNRFLKTKTVNQKHFLLIYFVQNMFYPEKVYTLASKLLSLFAIKYSKNPVNENGPFVQ